MPVLQKVHP